MYREIKIIGQGSHGMVKKVRKISGKKEGEEQEYAVKIIKTREKEMITNIRNEYRQVRMLRKHPNII